MDQSSNLTNNARRNEDIALDLLKFVAATAGVGRTSTQSTGFVAPGAVKSEDQVEHLLELYTRCLSVVDGKGAPR